MESPYERMRRLVAGLEWRRVARSTLVHFYQETQRFVTVNERGEIAITEQKRDLVFMPPGGSAKGGEQYLAYFHPQEPDFLHLTRLAPHKGYVATWVRRERVRSGDAEALQAAFRYTEGALKAQKDHLAKVTAGERAELEDMRASNAAIINEAEADMNAIAIADCRLPIADSQPSAVGAALDAATTAVAAGSKAREKRTRSKAELAALVDAALAGNYKQKDTEEPT